MISAAHGVNEKLVEKLLKLQSEKVDVLKVFLKGREASEKRFDQKKEAGSFCEICPGVGPAVEAREKEGKEFTFGWESGSKSDRPHWPPNAESGITIGAGYDMGGRDKKKVYDDLIASGVGPELAELLSTGSGKKGSKAETYLGSVVNYQGKRVRYDELQITREQERALFDRTYPDYAMDAERLATKADVVKKYGKADWKGLDPGIKSVLVDMRFRGDYSPAARKFKAPGDTKSLQQYVADNNVVGFKKSLQAYHERVAAKADEGIRKGLKNRFRAREELLGGRKW